MKGTLISIAPGVYIDPLVRRDINPKDEYVLLDDNGLKRIGLTRSQEKLILRLDAAGLIKLHSITPRRKLLSLSTWNAHLERLEKDPEYWEKPENIRRWRIACMAV